jgi:hypothetical protein
MIRPCLFHQDITKAAEGTIDCLKLQIPNLAGMIFCKRPRRARYRNKLMQRLKIYSFGDRLFPSGSDGKGCCCTGKIKFLGYAVVAGPGIRSC